MKIRIIRVFLLLFWLILGLVLLASIYLASTGTIGKELVSKFVWMYLFLSIIISGYLAYLKKIDRN